MGSLDRDVIFAGLTRPQMLGGVTYSMVVLNVVVSTEFFILFKSPWTVLAAAAFHLVGWAFCLREPRIFDIWRARATKCPRSPTWTLWRCNSYRP